MAVNDFECRLEKALSGKEFSRSNGDRAVPSVIRIYHRE